METANNSIAVGALVVWIIKEVAMLILTGFRDHHKDNIKAINDNTKALSDLNKDLALLVRDLEDYKKGQQVQQNFFLEKVNKNEKDINAAFKMMRDCEMKHCGKQNTN